MAAGCNSSPSSPLQNDIIALVLNLQQAIRNGNEEEAKNLACCLAQKKAFVNVDVCVEEPTVSISNKEIRIKVYVEDKDSSGVCVVLKLKPSMTIRQLKSKMLIEYGFPPEVQKWIVGKRAASDGDTLIRCGIKTDGMSMFLYLISPKSIGLSKAKILQKYRHLLPNGMLSNADTNSNTDNSSAVNSPNTDETDVATISRPNTNSSNATPANSEVRSHIRHHTENSKNGTTTTSAVNNLQTASPKKKADSKGKEGWACDMCTYINLPTRPGCEICGSPRPQSYKIPENYEITQEEKDRILAEREAERLAREQLDVSRSAGEITADGSSCMIERKEDKAIIPHHMQLSEEQLDQLLKLNDMYNTGEISKNHQSLDPIISILQQSDSSHNLPDASSDLATSTRTTQPIISRGLDYSDFGLSESRQVLAQPEDYGLVASSIDNSSNLYESPMNNDYSSSSITDDTGQK